MKLFSLFAFVFLSVGAVGAQQSVEGQTTENPSPCPKYPMPIIAPPGDANKSSSAIKPDAGIDYKLIIVNPCVVEPLRQSNPSVERKPIFESGDLLMSNPANGNISAPKTAGGLSKNSPSTIKPE